MDRSHILLITAGLTFAAAAAWVLLRPAVPADTLYFRWNEGRDARYELVVKHAAGNPEFRRGVTTTRVPRSGPLRVLGTAEPGATVEVSNPRTGRGYATTADASGAFAIDAEARAGDTLSILSRTIVFRAPEPPRYSSSAESSP